MRGGTDTLSEMNRKMLLLLAIAGCIVGFDQASKVFVHTHFQLSDTIEVVSGYFNITYVRNYGAAFGFMASSPEQFRQFFFLSMPPLALLFILVILRTVPANDKIQVAALSSIFGGAIGNYIDRLRYGYVVDFLDVHLENRYSWPAFNIADMAIVAGVLTLILLMVRDMAPSNSGPDPESESAP